MQYLNAFKRYCRSVISLNFGAVQTFLYTTKLARTICSFYKQAVEKNLKTIIKLFLEILIINYFREL